MLNRLFDWIKGRPDKPVLRDYVFIDRNRLLSYFQQISSPNKVLKKQAVPSWTVGLSGTGPQVSATQSSATRNATDSEMIADVERYLKRERLVFDPEDRRYEHLWGGKPFCHFKLAARRAVIVFEAKQQGLHHSGQLGIWIPQKASHAIYLIESSSEPDPRDVPAVSGYSALDFILHNLNKQQTLFRQYLADGHDIHLADIPSDERFKSFAADPSACLEEMGARLGAEKNIECLFRVRLSFTAQSYGRFAFAMIGYPLYISSDLTVKPSAA
jgi:hypothetical protein